MILTAKTWTVRIFIMLFPHNAVGLMAIEKKPENNNNSFSFYQLDFNQRGIYKLWVQLWMDHDDT